ncbi:Oidioi.mRNA.OKI2018_I69.chr1.g617.t1.cds [Oikopleura dioica]|uniref:Oidioi.mRNA.OKI2018_I69.chr1.g617.t1.cds n=1 Tax=Oikopleura dioica TaxID=34765 RepID=A0ABN7SM39_OIKDI|nr:Oidioi.mRNA.OKI2018_I69.chr1.g617.t1.cds [Oikopleura dioica]
MRPPEEDSALSGVDLSHLTEEERQIIMSVTMRATQVDQDREEKIRELEEEIASKEKIKSADNKPNNVNKCQCGLPSNTRCASCPDSICPKCAKISNGKKICNLCLKRNDLVAQSNEWIKKPGQMKSSQSDVPKMKTDQDFPSTQRRTNSLHGMNNARTPPGNPQNLKPTNPSPNPRPPNPGLPGQQASLQKPKPLPRGRSIDKTNENPSKPADPHSQGQPPATTSKVNQQQSELKKETTSQPATKPQNPQPAPSNSPQPPSIFKRQPSSGSIAGPPQPRSQVASRPQQNQKDSQRTSSQPPQPKASQQSQQPNQRNQPPQQRPPASQQPAPRQQPQRGGQQQQPQNRTVQKPPEPQPKSIFSSIFGSDPIPANPPPKTQAPQNRPQNRAQKQPPKEPSKQISSSSLFEQSSLPTFDLMPRKSASVSSNMADSQAPVGPPGNLKIDEKIKPPNYDLSPRKAKSIVPKSSQLSSPSPGPKSIFDTQPPSVQSSKSTEQNPVKIDSSADNLTEKNIDKKAEALSIVSEIEKMKQTENQRMKSNSGPQKLGPAETGSLKDHKEAQLNKFNSRISNQPVFPPNYLEFDSSDSSLGCDEDLALRKREFCDFPEPMKKLESPKIGENMSVLEMARQFNENDDSLPSSRNAFRHFDFEDDGEGDFENFGMSSSSTLSTKATYSGPLPLSHTLPKSQFDVPVSKKYDQFGRRKSDDEAKPINVASHESLRKTESQPLGGSADALDKVAQRATTSSSMVMKRTTSFEALKAVDSSYGSMKRSSSRKKDLTVIDPSSMAITKRGGAADPDTPIKRDSLTGTLSKCLFCGKGAMEKDSEYSSSRSNLNKIGAVARSSIAIQVQPVSRSSFTQVQAQRFSEATQTYRSYGIDQAIQVQMLSGQSQQPMVSQPRVAEPQALQINRAQGESVPRRQRGRHFSARSNRSRSSSNSRVSRRSSVYSDNEATEELSNCVRDLVQEVRELVNISRDPSPIQNHRYDQPQMSPSFPQQNAQQQQPFQQSQPVFQPIIQPQVIPQMIPIPQPYPISYPSHPPPPAHVTYYSSPLNPQNNHPPVHNPNLQPQFHVLQRPDSRRRLPEPPAGVAPVTLQPIGQANALELEHRMLSIKQRVEALDKEEKELDHRLKELQRKSCTDQGRSLHGYAYQDKHEARSSLPEAQQDHRFQ